MPLMIELMSPKWTMDRVSLVISFAIGALERMRARFALLGFKSRRISFVVSLTTLTELSMMFQLVRAVTFNAFCSLNPAQQGGVIPFQQFLQSGTPGFMFAPLMVAMKFSMLKHLLMSIFAFLPL